MNARVRLIVDGKPAEVEADPAMPLLYALRADLGLDNPKFGCGVAQCGACTVHVDGRPTRSCITPVSSVKGKRITTLAGLGTPEKPHPLQTAFIAEQVPQCGYCHRAAPRARLTAAHGASARSARSGDAPSRASRSSTRSPTPSVPIPWRFV